VGTISNDYRVNGKSSEENLSGGEEQRDGEKHSGLVGLDPVAGPAGNNLPHFIVDFIEIVVDLKFPAAARAAQCYGPST
jgi:hypothetical protein